MPAAPDLSGDGERADGPDFVDDDARTVGFVDLPDLDADRAMAAILGGFARLEDDAVLTAYCTDVDAETLAAMCEHHGVEVVHAVTHADGTTFVLMRSSC